MKECEVVIGHRLGLHARAAARLVQLAAEFQSTIVLSRVDTPQPVDADARSILSVLLLAAAHGSRVMVRAEGVDEEEALRRVCDYLSG